LAVEAGSIAVESVERGGRVGEGAEDLSGGDNFGLLTSEAQLTAACIDEGFDQGILIRGLRMERLDEAGAELLESVGVRGG